MDEQIVAEAEGVGEALEELDMGRRHLGLSSCSAASSIRLSAAGSRP